MKLSLTSITNGLVRVSAAGEITVRDFDADCSDPLAVLLGERWAAHRVVVDMSGVSFVDSTALGWFITWRRQFEKGGGMLVLHSVQPRVRQVLDMLKVGRVLPLAANEAAALKLAAVPAAGAAPKPQTPQAPPKPEDEQGTGSYDVKPAAAPAKPAKSPKPRRGTKAA